MNCMDCENLHLATPSQNNTILVVGHLGSGNSTFLNTLAGGYWKVDYDPLGTSTFVANQEALEIFSTDRSVKGCTLATVATNITTFDGRDITVIRSDGETANDTSSYETGSNLTQTVDQNKEISAAVIVDNSQDPRSTRGFVESLPVAYVLPASFTTKGQKHVGMEFSQGTQGYEKGLCGELPDRGLIEQVKIIRAVLDVNEEDEVKAFGMDHCAFQTYARAQPTIDTVKNILDHMNVLRGLSSAEFKALRELSQLERVVENEIRRYFQPSGENRENLSGFENLIFECAQRRAKNIKKASFSDATSKRWSDKLVQVLLEDISKELPKDIQKISHEVVIQVNLKSIPRLYGSNLTPEMIEGHIAKGVIRGGIIACIATAPISFGMSLAAIPACFALGYLHGQLKSKTWSREDAIYRVAFRISNENGSELCSQIMDQFSLFVVSKAEEIQKIFDYL